MPVQFCARPAAGERGAAPGLHLLLPSGAAGPGQGEPGEVDQGVQLRGRGGGGCGGPASAGAHQARRRQDRGLRYSQRYNRLFDEVIHQS